jgi:hypothetical protein
MSDLSEQQLARLANDVNNGHIIRSFCQHPGFKLYKAELDLILEDKKNIWLRGSDEDAKTERIRAQGVQKAVDILKQFILIGDRSAQIINNEVPNPTE